MFGLDLMALVVGVVVGAMFSPMWMKMWGVVKGWFGGVTPPPAV